jgi:predicted PurR-regulated permease PerM
MSPFPRDDTEELFTSIVGTVNGAILGVLVTAAIQGALTMASLYVFGVPGAFVLGVIATILAIIPMIGTTPVTFGAPIYLFATGRIGAGIGMIVMGVLIGLSDNVIRPWVQSSRTTMHPLIALLSIFGGLEVFGAAGIFVGPVLAAITIWIVDTYADLRMKQLKAYIHARLTQMRGEGPAPAPAAPAADAAPNAAAAASASAPGSGSATAAAPSSTSARPANPDAPPRGEA